MIDPADKETQSLPLEQPKRGRGRPSTGQAMTPAQKQKAYRDRQKSNVTKNRVDDLDENMRLREQLIKAIERAELAEARAQDAERELRSRDKKANPLEAAAELIQYHAQQWERAKRKWKTIGEENPENLPFDNWREAEKFIKELKRKGSQTRYRIIPANLPVIEYK